MSKESGRETLLNASPMSKTGLVLAQPSDSSSPDTPLLNRLVLPPDHVFKVGDRCYVGGNRPGIVAYVGETHFAPGEWVGIILDDPNGKNDGCVSGKRYFQCESKRGVFSRANRLSATPICLMKRNSSDCDSFEISRIRRSVSPTPSVSSVVSKAPGRIRDLQVGDRVIVSSGLGSRPGELKFIGETKFAAGNWCGVQLDEPNGKNDGSVDGIRYFDCPPKYGVFVPIAKVSLSPSARKSNISRSGSKESLTSIGTLNSVTTTNTTRLRMSRLKKPTVSSIALAAQNSKKPPTKSSFSMQDLIREKELYIERLMKERELDREDSQSQILFYQKTIRDLNEKNCFLEIKINEMESKNEELQNAVDEATFCGDELNILNQDYKEKIEILTKILKDNEIQFDPSLQIQNICAKCVELNRNNSELKENILSLNSEIEELKAFSSTPIVNQIDLMSKEDELFEKEAKISKLENEIIELKHEKEMLEIDMQEIKLQNETIMSAKSDELSSTQLKATEYQAQCIKLKEENLEILNKHLILQNNFEALEKQNTEKNTEIEKLTIEKNDSLEQLAVLKTDFENFKHNISKNDICLQKAQEKCEELTNSISELEKQKTLTETELQNALDRISVFSKENSEKFNEINTSLKNMENQNETLCKQIENLENSNDQQKEHIKNLQNLLEQKDLKLNTTVEYLNDIKSKLTEQETENILLKEQIVEKSAESKNFVDENQKLNEALENYKKDYEQLKMSLDENRISLIEINETKENQITELTVSLRNSIAEKEVLQAKVNNLIDSTLKMEKQLQVAEEKLINKSNEIAINIQSKQTLSAEISQIKEENEMLRKKLAQKELTIQENYNKITNLSNSVKSIEKDKLDLENTLVELRNANCEFESSFTKQLNDIKFENGKLKSVLDEKIKLLEEKICEIVLKDNQIENLLSQLKNLETELSSSIKYKESGDQELQKIGMALSITKDDIKQKELYLIEKDKKIAAMETLIKNLKSEKNHLDEKVHEMNENMYKLMESNKEKEVNVQSLENLTKEIQNKYDSLIIDKNRINEELIYYKNQVSDLKIEKDTLQTLIIDLQNTKEQYEKIIQTKDENLNLKDLDLNQKQTKISELENEVIKCQNSLQELQNKLALISTEYNLIESNLTKSLKSNETLQQIIEEKSNIVKVKIDEINSIRSEMMNLLKEKDNLQTNLQEKLLNEDNLNEKINILEKETILLAEKLSLAEQKNYAEKEKLEETTKNLNTTLEKLEINQRTITKLETDLTACNNQITELIGAKYDLENSIKSYQDEIINIKSTQNLEISEAQKQFSQLTEAKLNLEKLCADYQINLVSKEKQLVDALQNFENEKQKLLKFEEKCSKESLAVKEKFSFQEEKILSLQKENLDLIGAKINLEKQILAEQNMKSDLVARIEKLQSESFTQKTNYESLTKKHEKLLNDLSALDNSCKVLKDLESKVLDLQHINDILLEENHKLKEDIEKAGQERQDAINNAELLEFEHDKELEKEKQSTLQAKVELKSLSKQLKCKEKELNEIQVLYEMSSKKILEKAIQNENLEKEIEKLKSSIATSDYILKNTPVRTTSATATTNSDAIDQINFLNSIIADMHKKNETLKSRIDVLEMNAGDISKYFNFDILNKRKPVPRLFCDICDEFDQHDTEDCPLQSSDSPPISITYNTVTSRCDIDTKDAKKEKPPPREYCENCEMFGHDTKDCTNDKECF